MPFDCLDLSGGLRKWKILFHTKTQKREKGRETNKSLKGKVVIRKSRSMLFIRKKKIWNCY